MKKMKCYMQHIVLRIHLVKFLKKNLSKVFLNKIIRKKNYFVNEYIWLGGT